MLAGPGPGAGPGAGQLPDRIRELRQLHLEACELLETLTRGYEVQVGAPARIASAHTAPRPRSPPAPFPSGRPHDVTLSYTYMRGRPLPISCPQPPAASVALVASRYRRGPHCKFQVDGRCTGAGIYTLALCCQPHQNWVAPENAAHGHDTPLGCRATRPLPMMPMLGEMRV